MNQTSLVDIPRSNNPIVLNYLRLHNRILKGWFEGVRKGFWANQELLPFDETHAEISRILASGQPAMVGRLGGVEASIILWARQIPAFPSRRPLPHLFSDTASGSDIAGVRPRNKESYKRFAELIWGALQELDLQGVWSAGYEAVCLPHCSARRLFNVETIAPNGKHSNHWMTALKGKRLLVISPFRSTIEGQIPKLAKIWPGMSWFENTCFEVLQFPYLIQRGCPETWWQVYERIGAIVAQGKYDVVLLGCGGLGLPLAALGKSAGRVAIHLGGHLQLLFGIFGQRHVEQDWHRMNINESWVRPVAREVPECAPRVEGGGYW